MAFVKGTSMAIFCLNPRPTTNYESCAVGSSGAKMGLGGGSTAQIKPLLPATTSVETLDRKFKSEIRQRLFQVPLALTRILRCSNSQVIIQYQG